MLLAPVEDLEALLVHSSVPCQCAHPDAADSAKHPGKHFLGRELIEENQFVSCAVEATVVCFEADTREGKTPVYLCESCAGFWTKPAFSLLSEPLQ